jgi:diadenosine tetraphosphatase ApaH/serine/threonine PP2A family protein phosphatase
MRFLASSAAYTSRRSQFVPLCVSEDRFVSSSHYVHAGVRPGVPLKDQKDTDRLWIRGVFLRHRAPHEKYVVHGHTPVEKPDVRTNRVNLDTGLVSGGRLTAAVFDGLHVEAIDFFQVRSTGL